MQLIMNLKVQNYVPLHKNKIPDKYSTGNCCHFVITDLQDTTLALDFRVTALEENGGSDGNSSVAELKVRVEILEGTAQLLIMRQGFLRLNLM